MSQKRKYSLLTAASLAILLAGCSAQDAAVPTDPTAQTEMPAPQVGILEVAKAPVTIWDELPGRVSPYRIAEIRPQVSGLILRRLFEEGASVEAGEPLFEIDPATFAADVASAEAALQKANAALDQARNDRDRAQTLLDGNNISQQNFDQISSQYAQAAADVAQAQAALEKSRISLRLATVRAPIAGMIGAAMVSEGSLADAAGSTALARIQQIDKVYIDIRQPSSRLELLRGMARAGNLQDAAGIPVEVFVGDDEANSISAQALFSDITVDEGTGNVRMRVVADNPDLRLLPGMFIRAEVPRGTYPEAIIVPQQAIVRDLTGATSVYVVDADNNASPQPVEVGELVQGQYVIRNGLEQGQRVIVQGQDKLMASGPVDPIPYQAPQQAAVAQQAP